MMLQEFMNELTKNEEDCYDTNKNPIDGLWLEGDSLAPPCQADLDVVHSIASFIEPHMSSSSILYDLGCGDGRICIYNSILYQCRSIGCEIEMSLIAKFEYYIERFSLYGLVNCIHGDLQQLNFSDASVIVIYLLPDAIAILHDRLVDMIRNGCVLVCNTWGPKGLIPSERIQCGYCNNVALLKYDKSSIPAQLT